MKSKCDQKKFELSAVIIFRDSSFGKLEFILF